MTKPDKTLHYICCSWKVLKLQLTLSSWTKFQSYRLTISLHCLCSALALRLQVRAMRDNAHGSSAFLFISENILYCKSKILLGATNILLNKNPNFHQSSEIVQSAKVLSRFLIFNPKKGHIQKGLQKPFNKPINRKSSIFGFVCQDSCFPLFSYLTQILIISCGLDLDVDLCSIIQEAAV